MTDPLIHRLQQFTQDLAGPGDTRQLSQRIVDWVLGLLPAAGCQIFAVDARRCRVECLAAAGFGETGPYAVSSTEVAGQVAQRGTRVVVHDTQPAMVGLPLHWRGQLAWVLVISGPLLDAAAQDLATLVAAQAAIALGQAERNAVDPLQPDHLAVLQRSSQALSQTLEVEQIYAAACTAAGELVPSDVFAIVLCDDCQARCEAAYFVERGVRQTPDRADRELTLAGRVLRLRQPQVLRAPADWPPHPASEAPPGSALAVAIQTGERALGVMIAEAYSPAAYQEHDLRLFAVLASQAAAALNTTHLLNATRRQAEQMRLVNELGRHVGGILDFEALARQVGQWLETTFGYAHARLGLIKDGYVVFPPRQDGGQALARPERQIALDGPGLVAWVARHGQPRYAPDVRAAQVYTEDPYISDTLAQAVVPLAAHGRILGILDIHSDRPLPPDAAATLEAISRPTAAALDSARLFTEARQRAAEVSALLTTTLAVTGSSELDARLEAVALHARELVGAEACTIYQLSPDGRLLVPIIAIDELYAEETLSDRVVVGEGLIGGVARSRQGEIFNRADQHPRAQQIPGTPLTPECLMAVPLTVGERTTGVMAVYREGEREFSHHDFDLLSSFAAQAAVAIENAALYQTLRERADSLQAAYDELAEMGRLRDEMVQNISHELRTPLTFLRSYVELLLSGDLGALLPDQQRSLQVVRDKTDTLVRLVGDMITLQAVTPTTIAQAPVDLCQLARAAADGVAVVAQEAGVELVSELPAGAVEVRGDALRLSQVFDNLLGNALKFTGRGERISLLLQAAPGWARVEVRDTGIGIPAEGLDRIFERFYQVDGTATRRRGGIGLGLAICKLIVEAHGGRIGVESQAGAGSCFYFLLPRAGETGVPNP
ncbi:MAG: GAF domain-containing protein [Anaerolineales bacterium]|nr:GAF domain-containing protein [Anaerolineales bacterium]